MPPENAALGTREAGSAPSRRCLDSRHTGGPDDECTLHDEALNSMTKLSSAATKVFMAVIDGLRLGDAKRIDNAPRAFMAVSVDRLTDSVFAVAHRYEVNGDLISDPDVEFYVIDDGQIPGDRAICPTAIDRAARSARRFREGPRLSAGPANQWPGRYRSRLGNFAARGPPAAQPLATARGRRPRLGAV